MKKALCALSPIVLLAFFFFTQADACSVFSIRAKDKTIISARTMEFGHDMGYAMIVVPRDKSFVSPVPAGINPVKWKTKYGYVANNVLGKEDGISDGLNEAGLSFSLLWYDSDMIWQSVSLGDQAPALANVVFGSWILGNFGSVKEAVQSIDKVRVFGHALGRAGVGPRQMVDIGWNSFKLTPINLVNNTFFTGKNNVIAGCLWPERISIIQLWSDPRPVPDPSTISAADSAGIPSTVEVAAR
jgi:hypothetical protein